MSDKPCPACGHCPTCGRSHAKPFNPYPWTQPYGTYPGPSTTPYMPWGITPGGTIKPQNIYNLCHTANGVYS